MKKCNQTVRHFFDENAIPSLLWKKIQSGTKTLVYPYWPSPLLLKNTPGFLFSVSLQIGCIQQFLAIPKGLGGLSTITDGTSTVFLGLQCCDLYSFPAASLDFKPAHKSRVFLKHAIFMLHLTECIPVAFLLLSILLDVNLCLGTSTQSWSHQEYIMSKITVMVALELILA